MRERNSQFINRIPQRITATTVYKFSLEITRRQAIQGFGNQVISVEFIEKSFSLRIRVRKSKGP